jgi:hypothetical protein
LIDTRTLKMQLAVRVAITGYTLLLGAQMPFLVGASSTYNVNLAPATTMPYMK